ncbi:MAG: outer membrane protein assembly factor BamB, partial [Planctomycetota bacterium]
MRISTIAILASGVLALPVSAQDDVASWPQFRGPGGLSVAGEGAIPLDFGPKKHVLWKTELPAGHSSPCVHG